MGGVIPGLWVLHSISKQAEEAMRSRPVRSTVHGLASAPACRFLPFLVPVLTSVLSFMMNCDVFA